MAKKIKVKLILELRAANMSRNTIAKTRKMAKDSVSDVIHLSKELGISYEDVKDKSEEEVYRIFYPDKFAFEHLYGDPDYENIHKELKRVGVTLKLLWQEYCDKCSRIDKVPMGYTKFCKNYKDYIFLNKLTNHLSHKPGVITEVDWSGPTMEFIDPSTGEIITVYLFVATLPYSQYSYVEPTLDMKQDTWLRCHVNMYNYFQGVTIRTVCDNLKTGVIKHPKEGDIVLNQNYEALGSHYLTAIMPTGIKKPKQKASVEATVGKIATAIIATLRNNKYFSFDDLKLDVKKELKKFNEAPFQKRPGSRKEIFEEEKIHLRPLPEIPYEIAEWIYKRKINNDFHIVYEKNRYSCPYQYIGKYADLKVTDTSLEIYVSGERVATHTRFENYMLDKYSTLEEHMPEQFKIEATNDQTIKDRASSIGDNTLEVIERIFAMVKVKEQGYNPSLSILRLSKTYSPARLETACEYALSKIKSPRYKHLKSILSSNQDQIYLENKNISNKSVEVNSGYIRGPEYYGGGLND